MINAGRGRSCLETFFVVDGVLSKRSRYLDTPCKNDLLLIGEGLRRVLRGIVRIDFLVRQRIPFHIDFQMRQYGASGRLRETIRTQK